MSRFSKLSHVVWHCQYHIVWVPKYRYRILVGKLKEEVVSCIHAFTEQQKSEVIELNVQILQCSSGGFRYSALIRKHQAGNVVSCDVSGTCPLRDKQSLRPDLPRQVATRSCLPYSSLSRYRLHGQVLFGFEDHMRGNCTNNRCDGYR